MSYLYWAYSNAGSIGFHEQETYEYGTQCTVLSGMGTPPVSAQFDDRAQGAVYRRTRVQPKDMDLTFSVKGTDEADLRERLQFLFNIICGTGGLPSTTVLVATDQDTGASWSMPVAFVGGGSITLGGSNPSLNDVEAEVTFTVRAGDPYWTNWASTSVTVASSALSSGGASITLANPDADAGSDPVFVITGPASDIVLNGSGYFHWSDSLSAGETLTVDMGKGTVRDGTGANRYNPVTSTSVFWQVSGGSQSVYIGVGTHSSATHVVVTWSPRRKLVV